MKADKKERELLHSAIDSWLSEGKLSPQQATDLKDSIEPEDNNHQVAQYFFFISISCILLSFGAIFIDDKWLERVKNYFSLNNLFIAITFTLLSAVWFVLIYRKRSNYSKAVFEVYSTAGSLLAITALAYYCKDIGFGPKYSGFLLAVAVVLFTLSRIMQSNAMWLGGIAALMGWYGAFAEWQSSRDLFLGMNYPVRFSVFGLIIVLLSFAQKKVSSIVATHRHTYFAGLIILLTGLWGVSIFGNYNSLDAWAQVRQTQVIAYAILFATVAGAFFYYGIKYKDDATRDIALVALLLNLYSRYFEFFWNTTNKGIFFLILAISFWFIGRRIEKYKRKQHTKQIHTR